MRTSLNLMCIAGIVGGLWAEAASAQNLDVKGTMTGEGNASFYQNVTITGGLTVAGALNVQGANVSATSAGIVTAFAGAVAPTGYLLCNGQAVSRTAYSRLFGVIGTSYGAGDGSTTFNVPDLRGEFVRGLDAGRGVDAGRTLGGEQLDAMQGHYHNALNSAFVVTGPGQNWVGGSGSFGYNTTTGAPCSDGTHGTPRIAGETRPRSVALNYIIAY